MIVPVCLEGALESEFQVVLSAASFAGFNRHAAVFVDPLPPATARITFPVLSTVMLTTTMPSSSQSGCSLGFDKACTTFRCKKRYHTFFVNG